MITGTYEGFELTASSRYLPEKQKWDSTIAIVKLQSNTGKTQIESFTQKNFFDTENEAIENAYLTGKVIVDGKHPEFTLPF